VGPDDSDEHGRLRGRREPVDRLEQLLHDASVPGAVITGRAGIGKSSVAQHLAAAARGQGWDVHVGNSSRLDSGLPFAPLVEALGLVPGASDPRAAEVGRLLRSGDVPALGPGQLRWQVTDAIVDVLDAAARARPLLLLIEDLHWADVDTLSALGRAWRAARQLELAVVATTRPHPRSDELDAALREAERAGCLSVELGELSDEDIAAVAGDRLDAPPGPRLRALLAKAGGNPFYAIELLTALRQEGRLHVADGAYEADASAMDELSSTLMRRLEIAPAPLRRLLAQAAVLGRRFDLAELALLRGETPTDTWSVLEPAVISGLLLTEGPRLAFRHDLIHEALYAELPATVRASVHDEVARLLARADTDPERVGAHLVRGTATAANARRLLALAEAVTDRAPELAASWVDAVQTLLPVGDGDRLRARLVEARAAALSEDPDRAVRVARALLDDGLDPLTAGELWATIAQAQFYLGATTAETAEALADAVALLRDDQPRKARLAALTARTLRAVGRADEASALARSTLAADVDDAGARAVALGMLARQALDEGNAPAAFDLADRALELTQTSGTLLDWTGIEVVKDFGWVRSIDVEDERIVRVCQQVIADGERLGLRAALPTIQAELAETLRFRGRWAEAEAYAQAALDGLDASRYASVEADAWFTLLSIAARRGDVQRFAQLPAPLTNSESNISLAALTLDQAWALAHSGEDARGWRMAEAARRWYETDAPDFMFVWTHPYVRLALARGEHDRAASFTALIAAAAERMGDHPIILAQARMAQALLTGDADVARDALQLARLGPVFPNRIDALIVAGEVLGANGDRAEAIEHLQQARALAAAAEATVDLGRIDAALRALGVIAHRARRRPTTGWEALSEVEGRVVGAVVEGLTYREVGQRLYISRRTVETHVASVFRKLGVRSRNDLTAAWHARAAAPAS
jgi:DNA-binding CsgD family transcriptional regulator